jgi:hypothetical protein
MVSKSFLKYNSKINVLHNRAILYFVLFLSTINLVSYGLVKDFLTPTIFILVAIITSFFSKNMTVILSVALVFSNVIKQGAKIRLSEGMDTNIKLEKKDKEDKEAVGDSVVDEDKTTDTVTPVPIDTKKDNVQDINVIEKKYKELLILQDTILGNINALEDSLGSAEKIVKSMTKTVSPP